jgi:hypothetical protein
MNLTSLFASKLLIATGPKYKDEGCTEHVEVEVDLVPPGIVICLSNAGVYADRLGDRGTPTNDVLRNNQVMLHLNNGGKTEGYKGLNMLYLVKTMICYCKNEDLVWDPKMDVLFLCQNYGKEIEAIQSKLNAREIQENYLGTPFVLRLPLDVRRRCYHVLLGADKEPPPSVSLTLAPGHRSTASASDTNERHRITSHRSTPSLSTNQKSSNYLSPPPLGKFREQQTEKRSNPPSQTCAPILKSSNIATKSPTEKNSRSRYRQTTVPSAPKAAHQLSPDATSHTISRPRSAERTSHQRTKTPVSKTQMMDVQENSNLSKQRMLPNRISASIPSLATRMKAQRSMPNMIGRHTASVPVFAHAQNASSLISKGLVSTPQVMPASSALQLLGDTSQRTQTYGRSQRPPYSWPLAASGNVPMAQPLPLNTERMPRYQLTADAIGTNSSRNIANSNSQTVGPNGISTSATNTSPDQSQPKNFAQRLPKKTISSTTIFELEARTSHSMAGPQYTSPENFIAELPAEIDVIRPTARDNSLYGGLQMNPPQGHQKASFARPPHFEESPISPPHDSPPTLAQVPPQLKTIAMPAIRRTQYAPPNSLPASLMIGARRHSPDHSISLSLPQTNSPPANVSNYQQYYFVGSTVPYRAQASPEHAPVSVYMAYSSPISHPTQPIQAVSNLQDSTPTHTSYTHAKYDSHHGQYDHTVNSASSVTGTGAVGAAGYEAFSYKSVPEGRYRAFDPAHPTQNLQPHAEHNDMHEQNYFLPYVALPALDSSHHRSTSQDSQNSTSSHDSEKLALEYQADLPDFENGYGSDSSKSKYSQDEFTSFERVMGVV